MQAGLALISSHKRPCPPDYYFRGTLAQFWVVIYAEYQRLAGVHGSEPFEFASPDPQTSPLGDYSPKYYDFVEILFWGPEHRHPVVRVVADSVLDSDLVNLYVSIDANALKKYGESVLRTWNEIKVSLTDQNLLILPTAHLALMSEPLPRAKTGADLGPYFERHHQRRALGQNSTLIQIAAETGFAYRYVRQLHSVFLRKGRRAGRKKRTGKTTGKTTGNN
jgi:hypothetical protein